MADIAITGASGLVGGSLLAHLVAEGKAVDAIVRSETSAHRVAESGAHPVIVDLFDRSGMRDALWGTPLAFHVAGVNETCVRDPSWMNRVNIEGTRAMIEAAADAGVARIVYTSSAATIGERSGVVGREHTVHDGTFLSEYARSKTEAERVAFTTAAERDIELVAVNPSSVQGPGRASGSARLFLYALKSRRPVLFDAQVSIVDIRDCTAGHVAASARGVAGERYLLSGHSIGVVSAIAMLSEVGDREVRPLWVSEGFLRTVGRAAARLASWFSPSSGACPALVDTLLHGHRFDGSRAERELGVTYHSLEETLAATVRWFESEGLIDPS